MMQNLRFLDGLPRRRAAYLLAGAILISVTVCMANAQCTGLHAGITAQILDAKLGYTQSPMVMITFLVVNDSDSALDVSARSWKIVIDGVELTDSGWIFGNGPAPQGGYKSLAPGEHYELGKDLPVGKYFPRPGEHTVMWKGDKFHSSTVTVKVP